MPIRFLAAIRLERRTRVPKPGIDSDREAIEDAAAAFCFAAARVREDTGSSGSGEEIDMDVNDSMRASVGSLDGAGGGVVFRELLVALVVPAAQPLGLGAMAATGARAERRRCSCLFGRSSDGSASHS